MYPDRLIVKALIIMVIRRLYTAYSLLAFLEQETTLTQQLRTYCLTSKGVFLVAGHGNDGSRLCLMTCRA